MVPEPEDRERAALVSEPIPPRPDAMHPTAGTVVAGGPPTGLGARPTATWSWWEGTAVYVISFIVGGLATVPILSLLRGDDDLATIASTTAAAIAIIAILVGWLSNAHRSWRNILGFPPRGGWGREVLTSIGFGLLLYPAMVFVVGIVVALILQVVSGETAQAPEQVAPDQSAVGIAITALYALVVAPLHEELFFRGILFRAVRDRYGLVRGLLATGFGFALIHYLDAPWQDALLLMGVMFFNGIALAWWYERRGTIVAPVVAHVVFNVIGLSLILAFG